MNDSLSPFDLDEIIEEFTEQCRSGQRPSVEDYATRYPQFAEEIRDLFPTLLAMEQAAPESEDEFEQTQEGPPVGFADEDSCPDRLGDYRIVREIGRGGMGVVYEAEQESLGRHVALKILPKQLMADSKQRRRFTREARAAARLHHTNIVPVFGVGQADGISFYAMQFIPGMPLNEVLDAVRQQGSGIEAAISGATRDRATPLASANEEVTAANLAQSMLSGQFHASELDETTDSASAITPSTGVTTTASTSTTRERVNLNSDVNPSGSVTLSGSGSTKSRSRPKHAYWESVARIGQQAADALGYAHSQGVIHRDIKPGNLLLDLAGTVWITDFGLAKAEEEDDLTKTGDLLGTLRYMPPESLKGKADARSDIFSLGLTLYELAAKRPAYDESGRHSMLQRITDANVTSLQSIDRSIPRDLETIIHKSVAADPKDRYQSAEEMAADLERFLNDEPIHARRMSLPERFTRWSRRNPMIAGLGAACACLLLLISVVASIAYLKTHAALDLANRRELETNNALLIAREKEEKANDALNLAERRERETRNAVINLQAELGLMASERGDLSGAALWFSQTAESAEDFPDLRRANSTRFRAYSKTVPLPYAAHRSDFLKAAGRIDSRLTDLKFSPDGRFLLAGAIGRGYELFDLQHEDDKGTVWSGLFPCTAACWRSDGQHIALSVDGKMIEIREFPSGKLLEKLSPDGEVSQLSFTPDGAHLVIAGEVTRVWNCREGRFVTARLLDAKAVRVVFGGEAADQRIAFAASDNKLHVFAFQDGTLSRLHDPLPHDWRHEPIYLIGGTRIITSFQNKAHLRDGFDGRPIESWTISSQFGHIGATAGGSAFGLNTRSFRVDVLEGSGGSATSTSIAHKNYILDIAFSADERFCMTASTDRTVRLTPLDEESAEPIEVIHQGEVAAAVFAPDGKTIATLQRDGLLRAWKLPAEDNTRWLALGHMVRIGRDGRYAVRAGSPLNRSLRYTEVFSTDSGNLVGPRLPLQGLLNDAAFSSSGGTLVTLCSHAQHRDQTTWKKTQWANQPGWIQFWSWPDGRQVLPAIRTPSEPINVDWHPHENCLVVVCAAGEVLLIDGERGEVIKQRRHQGEAMAGGLYRRRVMFSRDGDLFFTFGLSNSIITWNTNNGDRQQEFVADSPVRDISLATDGQFLAGSTYGKTVQVWDLDTGLEVVAPLEHPDWVFSCYFSPDGRLLLTSCRDSVARLWDWRTGQIVGAPMVHRDEVFDARFLPGQSTIVTASRDGSARLWDVTTGRPLTTPLVSSTKRLHRVSITPDGRRLIVSGDATAWIDLVATLGLSAPTLDLAKQRQIAELIAGRRIVQNGQVNLTSDDWYQLWQQTEARSWIASLTDEKADSSSEFKATQSVGSPSDPKNTHQEVAAESENRMAPPLAATPFDGIQAFAHQQAWANYLNLPAECVVELGDGVEMEFVLIPPGEFPMGSTAAEQELALKMLADEAADLRAWAGERISAEGPQRLVRITKPFYLGKNEVTRAQFRQFIKKTAYRTFAESDGKGGQGIIDGKWNRDPRLVWNYGGVNPVAEDVPVSCVSWTDAQAFCQWLQGLYPNHTFSLPTEAQWEFACRAGADSPWNFGANFAELPLNAHTMVGWSGAKPHPIGKRLMNAFGLHDMHGNVEEHCVDHYQAEFYQTSANTDPSGPTEGEATVHRGGCGGCLAAFTRSAFRGYVARDACKRNLGFRVSMSIDALTASNRQDEVLNPVSREHDSNIRVRNSSDTSWRTYVSELIPLLKLDRSGSGESELAARFNSIAADARKQLKSDHVQSLSKAVTFLVNGSRSSVTPRWLADQTIDLLETELIHDSESIGAWRSLADLNWILASRASEIGDSVGYWRRVKQSLTRIIELDDASADSYRQRAYVLDTHLGDEVGAFSDRLAAALIELNLQPMGFAQRHKQFKSKLAELSREYPGKQHEAIDMLQQTLDVSGPLATKENAILIAEIHAQRGNWDRAEELWQRIDKTESDSNEAEALRVELARSARQWPVVAEYYSAELNKMDPSRHKSHPRLRLLHQLLADDRPVFDELRKLRPDDTLLEIALAHQSVLLQRWDDAVGCYANAIVDQDPGEQFEYAAALLMAGRSREYEAFVQNLIKNASSSSDPNLWWASARAACISNSAKLPWQQIADLAQRANDQSAGHWRIRVNALAKIRKGDFQQAESLLDSIPGDKTPVLIHAALGLLNAQQEEWEHARKFRKKAQAWIQSARSNPELVPNASDHQVWLELLPLLRETDQLLAAAGESVSEDQ